jgi:hypothetical protein
VTIRKDTVAFVPSGTAERNCSIPNCNRPPMRTVGVGHAEYHCRYHVQFRARHGSHWHPTYKAADLKPYLAVASEWIDGHREELPVAYPLKGLEGLLEGSGQADRAQDIKRLPAGSKARVAFARLREAGIEPERLLAIHMAVGALIEDDNGSHRVEEFRLVQTAKAVHRLASGIVLRMIGREIDEICGGVAETAQQEVIAARLAKFGPHHSHLPGWKPLWMQQRDAAKTAALRK